MNALRAVATASGYLLSAVAGCAAPLWCAVLDHGPTFGPAWNGEQLRTVCRRCGEDA